jgi:hypothetical protein
MKRFLFLFFILCSSVAFAGSADAILTCKSASGRTIFQAGIQDLVGFSWAKFAIDGQEIAYDNEGAGQVVFNEKHKIFTLSINDSKKGFLTFYAIPSTFEVIKKSNYEKQYKFQAVIQGLDPRKGKHQSKNIVLNCELKYSI